MDWFKLDITRSPHEVIDIKVNKLKFEDKTKKPILTIDYSMCCGCSGMWINGMNMTEKEERQREILDKIADLVIELEKEL